MKKQIYIILFVALFIFGCVASSTKGGTVGANRGQLMLVSSAQMQQGANKAYHQIMSEAQKKGALNKDSRQVKRIRAIASRIIPEVKVFREDALNWDWRVNLLQSNQLNAWCMPGGKIAFYSGIINRLQLSDDEIAAIMGHEISHALREHSRERASRQQIKNIGLLVGGALIGASNQTLQLANLAARYAIELPFSREHEREADKMGVELAARAGYDPYAAVNLWKKMDKIAKKMPFQFLSTHPSSASRIQDISVVAKKVYPLYKQAR